MVSLLIEATKTLPFATSGTLNFVAKSNVSRVGTWSLLYNIVPRLLAS